MLLLANDSQIAFCPLQIQTDQFVLAQRVLSCMLFIVSVCARCSQVQMYQLSRLLHDYHRELYNHLEEHEICPSLYAAPWFLTLFASQFPLNFVSRIFGIFFSHTNAYQYYLKRMTFK